MSKETIKLSGEDVITNYQNKEVPIKRWLHQIKYITCDYRGTIFWKGVCIDVLKDSNNVLNKPYLQDLGKRCEYLESIYVPVSIKTVVFFWTWFCDMRSDGLYKKLLSRCPDVRVCKNKILFIFENATCEYNGEKWIFTKRMDMGNEEFSAFFSYSALKARGYKGVPLTQSDLDGLYRCFKHYKVPTNLLDIMADKFNPKLGGSSVISHAIS